MIKGIGSISCIFFSYLNTGLHWLKLGLAGRILKYFGQIETRLPKLLFTGQYEI